MGTSWRTVLFKHRDNNATNMMYILYANRNTSVPNTEITNGTTVRAANGTAQIPANAWSHLAGTYDGTTLRLFVNGTQVSEFATAGSIAVSTGELWVGGNNIWGEWFTGLIDEIRVYNRALTAAEVTTDMNRSVGVPDTQAPTTPGNLQKTGATATSISVSWTASTDNVGLSGYRIYRGTTEVGTTTNTSFTVGSLSCGSAHDISVEAFDSSDNESPRATINTTTSPCDTTPPTVSVTAPSAGETVSGTTVSVTASAGDNDSVAGVQFLVDGAPLGSEDTAAPYSVTWNTWSHANGPHTVTARARDASGNSTTSGGVSVTVANTGLPPQPGLVASYGFDEGSGTAAADSTGNGNHGTLVNGPTWTLGRFGQALSFDGTNDRVTVPDANTLDLTTGMTLEAWLKPTATGTAWKTVLFKHRDNNATNMVYVMYGNRNTNVPNGEITVGTSVKAANGPAGSGLPLNVWSHLAATFDNATLRLYVNGTEIASLATAGPIATSTGALWIGGNNVWNEVFSGAIDEVRIYNRALNASEIQTDMNLAAAPDSDPPAIVSTTPADGATGFGVGSPVTATFDEAMDPASITASTFELRTSGGTLIPATVSYDSLAGRATLTPASPLAFDSGYTATVKGGASGVKDFAENALPADRTWSFVTAAPPPPIAVVSSTANRFGSYAVEMLKAEGLNAVDTIDLASLSAATLSARDVVVLGEAPLSAAQVTTLTNWVNGGGNLIALRPDKQLAGLLGITDAASTLSNAYMRIDTTPGGPGAGLTGVTMQFHGIADRYNLNGATALATLYNTSTTVSANPAVTLRTVNATNGGQAAAFTYDLARSIVYTRQGNPAWAGQDRDGVAPARTNDLFYGAMQGDVQPDWLDTQKIGIPQADEQQRLLANLVLRMNRDKKPLPRFWYLPRDEKAAVIMTGDDHAVGGTAGRFDQHIAQSAPGCSVADWECIRGTSYIYSNSPLTNAQAGTYNAAGFEVSLHMNTGCQTNSSAQINADYTNQLAAFATKYTSIPAPRTNRTHCVAWSDWSTEPKTELAHGIRLDTNYYHFAQGWIGALPGYMTGSGLLMRFADLDGSTINTWQAHTHLNDEAGQVYTTHINYLLDNAIGANGYYGLFTMNMHTDNAVHPGSDAIVASAQARGVPVITAKQALEWVDGRDASTLSSFTWNSNQLSFTIRPGTGARGLRAMLPTSTTTANLTGITRDGGTVVPYTLQTIKGLEYAVFDAQNARYTATYGP
jgi:chitodextrinase